MSDLDTAAKKKQRVRRLLSFLLAGAAIAFVVWMVPIRDRCSPGATGEITCEPGLGSILAHAHVGWLVAMAALYALGTFAWAIRWRELLELAELRLSPLYVWRVIVEAQAGGILLPGGVAGDALRVGAMVGKGVPLSIVIASVLLDRVVGLVTLASVAGVLALGGGFGGAALGTSVAVTLAAFPIAFVVGLAIVRSGPVARFLSEGPLAKIAREPVRYLTSPRAVRAIVRATIASVVVSLLQLLIVRGLVTAVGGVPIEARWVYLGTAMAFMVAAVPVLPGGWGTSDAAFVFFFRYAGLSPQVALAACLLYRAFWYLSGVVGALLRVTRPALPNRP